MDAVKKVPAEEWFQISQWAEGDRQSAGMAARSGIQPRPERHHWQRSVPQAGQPGTEDLGRSRSAGVRAASAALTLRAMARAPRLDVG